MTLLSRIRTRTLPLVSGIWLAAILLSPAGAEATTLPIRFDMTIYGHCVKGWGAVASVVWRDAAGVLKATGGPDNPSGGGFWTFCPADQTLAVLPGDRITVSGESYTRNYVVPDLTLVIDRVHNVVYGAGPASRTIHLCGSWSFYWGFGDCWRVRVGQDGNWTFNPRHDLFGGMHAYVTWTSPNGDSLFLDGFPPGLGVTLGEPSFSGRTSPLAAVQVSLDSGQVFTSAATADASGTFTGAFTDSGGNPVSVSAGDHVRAPSLASDADWIVPQIDGRANKVSNVVKGSCSDTGTSMHTVRISVVRADGRHRGDQFVSIKSDGTFRADFDNYFGGGDVPVSANIKLGDEVWIDCLQTTGDWARLTFEVS